MRRSKVGYLGFLGFLGALGVVTGNQGFFGFFGFFGLFSALWGRGSDERVDKNINRACRNTFFFTILALTLFISYIAAFQVSNLFQMALSVLFAGNIILFVASFIYYDQVGE